MSSLNIFTYIYIFIDWWLNVCLITLPGGPKQWHFFQLRQYNAI